MINEQWQRFNLLSFENQSFTETQIEMKYDDVENIERFRKRSIIYYVLNILHDAFLAKENDAISPKFADSMTRDQVRNLLRSEEEFYDILEGFGGYDDDFTGYIKEIIKEIKSGQAKAE